VAAAAAVPSRQSVAMLFVEQERVFLSSIGWNALARVSPSSDLSIEQKKSEEKRLRYFNKHIRVLRQRFSFDSTDDSTKEPVYLTCAEAQARITDLTAYVSHIMEFNNFYDTALVLRDFSETKIYAPMLSMDSSVVHEYPNFISFMNYEPQVKQAPCPRFEYGPIPSDSNSEVEISSSTSPLPSERVLETRDSKLTVPHNFPLHSHTFLPSGRRAVGVPWKFNYQPGVDNKRR